jgi:hypothetical protein
MILENKKPNIRDFYDTYQTQLHYIFEKLLYHLKKAKIQIYNRDIFYREYIIYAYQFSAHI